MALLVVDILGVSVKSVSDRVTKLKRGLFHVISLTMIYFGKIAAGLESQGIPSPTGRPKWNLEAIDKLLSNEKYTGRVLLQKTISTGTSQIENDGLMERYLYTGTHEAIISDELFAAAQEAKQERAKSPQNKFAIDLSL